MKWKNLMLTAVGCAAIAAVPAFAQQAQGTQMFPTPGCTATPAQLEANKKVALEFFKPGTDRLALADPSYKQHNPAFVKRARDKGISDIEEFRQAFANAGRGGGGRGPATGPTPPPGNPLEIVTAECDVVTVVHKNFRQDPTAEPGKFYEAFTFDTFRIKDGKLVEHWDSAVINPPAPAGAPGGRGQ
jgi:predicted SnoaL-like aldol condensation-catalyzing enzyme